MLKTLGSTKNTKMSISVVDQTGLVSLLEKISNFNIDKTKKHSVVKIQSSDDTKDLFEVVNKLTGQDQKHPLNTVVVWKGEKKFTTSQEIFNRYGTKFFFLSQEDGPVLCFTKNGISETLKVEKNLLTNVSQFLTLRYSLSIISNTSKNNVKMFLFCRLKKKYLKV